MYGELDTMTNYWLNQFQFRESAKRLDPRVVQQIIIETKVIAWYECDANKKMLALRESLEKQRNATGATTTKEQQTEEKG